ncbi:hypothetical protein WJX84_000045 [Apatococcus fuscideae]
MPKQEPKICDPEAAPTIGDVGRRDSSHNAIASVARISRRRGPMDSKYVWDLLMRHFAPLCLAGGCLIFCTCSNLAAPVISGALVQTLVDAQPLSKYSPLLAALGTLYILEPLLTRIYIRTVCQVGERVLAALRLELFRTLLMQKIEFFDKHSHTELTSLISVEVDALRSFVFNNVSRDRGLRALLEAVGAVVVLYCLSWRLGPILALVIIATGLTAAMYKRQTKTVEAKQLNSLAAMVDVADQAFSNIKTVRSFAGEALERERFGVYVSDSMASGIGFANAKANLESLNRFAVHLSLLALYGLGGWLVSNQLMPIRTLLSAIGFTFSLVFATQGVVQTFSDARRALVSLRRLQSLLAGSKPDAGMATALPPGAWWEHASNQSSIVVEPYGADAGDAAVQAARSGPLELQNVCFTYPLRPTAHVLRGLDISLPFGSQTAIVGRSGAGKSTVVALLSRFYEPDSGVILLGGQDITSFSRGEWARAVSLVSQEPVLFSGSIADNISYGRYGRCSLEQVIRAAQAANAHDFITALPQGYDTLVGDRGLLLSGGQRQRVAIARALLKDSPIIILDEATSSLDAKTERLLSQAIERLTTGRTTIVVAHRLSTIQAADKIVMLEDGKAVEQGTHEELIAQPTRYRDLVSSQSLTLRR